MRVLHVIPSVAAQDGGPSRAVLGMAGALAAAGAEVEVATTDAGDEPPPAAPAGVLVRGFPRLAGRSFKWSPRLSAWLGLHVGSFDVVHVHAIFNHSTIAAARACRASRVPYVVRPLGTLSPWSLRQRAVRKRLAWQLLLGRLVTGAAAVHYTTEEERAATESALGLGRGVVIPLGVDAQRLREEARLAPPAGRPTILCLGRIDEKKRLEVVLAAFARARARCDQARLVIAGAGDLALERRLRRQARALGVEGAVEWPGWVDGARRAGLLATASALVLASHQENFGLAAVEAMSLGTPVILARTVDLAALVEAAGAGWVVEATPAGLAEAMVAALLGADGQVRGAAAARLASERFTWPRVGAALLELYQRVRVTR